MVEIATPKSFFGVIPIQTGAEIIAAVVVINKASAPYGLGALFTGKGLTPMQWIFNVLSFIAFPISIWGYLGILKRRPLRTLVFAHFYIIDTLVSLGFTIYFIIFWFGFEGKAANNLPQGEKSLHSNLVPRYVRENATLPAVAANDYSKSTTTGQELATTVVATSAFLIMRFYFMLTLVGYTRILVRQCNMRPLNGNSQNPWHTKAQYMLLQPFENFWTGYSSKTRRRSAFGPAETQGLQTAEVEHID